MPKVTDANTARSDTDCLVQASNKCPLKLPKLAQRCIRKDRKNDGSMRLGKLLGQPCDDDEDGLTGKGSYLRARENNIFQAWSFLRVSYIFATLIMLALVIYISEVSPLELE